MKIMYISFILVTFIQVLTWSLSHLALNQYENETQFYLVIVQMIMCLKSIQDISFTPKTYTKIECPYMSDST